MAEYSIKNLVVSVELGVPLPLEKLASELPTADYNPEQFPGLILRLDRDPPTLLIFNSGKINITGSKSIEQAKEVVERFRKILKEMGIETPDNYKMEVRTQNYVLTGKFDIPGDKIDIIRLAEELDNVNYDPEQFPGAVVKFENVTFLLFKNGKFVCTGAKSLEEAEEKIKKFEKIVRKYAKK